MYFRYADVIGHGVRYCGSIAGQESNIVDADLVQFGHDPGRFRTHAIAGANYAKDNAFAHYDQGRLAGLVQPFKQLAGLWSERDALLFQEPLAPHHHLAVRRARDDSRAGMSNEFLHAFWDKATLRSHLDDYARDEVFAFLFRRRRRPQQFVC